MPVLNIVAEKKKWYHGTIKFEKGLRQPVGGKKISQHFKN